MSAGQDLAIAEALSWLRAHVAAGAHLHADTRTLASGDVFLGLRRGWRG